MQTVGGLGANAGRDLRHGRQRLTPPGPAPRCTNTVDLLTAAYNNLTSPDLGAAKNYFANGTTNGTTPAVAPAGFTLPTVQRSAEQGE